ncbi:hypothetical protein JL721_12851 [Aureococcus anophagefferens]|nr:hypothetical protein JL721_12851 [Aureococcus anophagefferens]
MLAAAPVRLWLFDKSAVPTRCYGELAVAGAPHYVVVDAPLFFADVISCIDKNFSSLAAEAYRPGNGTGVFSSHCDYVKVVLNGSGYSYGGASAAGLRLRRCAAAAANLKKKNLTIPQCTLGINGDGRQFQFHVDDITSAARCVFACGPGAKALAQRLSRFHGGVVRTILVDEGAVLIMPAYVMTKNPGNVDGHFAQAYDGDVAASDYIMHWKLPDEFVASLLGVDGPCSNTGVFDVADASGAKAYDQVAGEIACSSRVAAESPRPLRRARVGRGAAVAAAPEARRLTGSPSCQRRQSERDSERNGEAAGEVCRFFRMGRCKHGANCKYVHATSGAHEPAAAGPGRRGLPALESIMGTPQLVHESRDLVAALRAAGGDAFRVKVHVTGCDCHRAAAFGEVAPGLLAIPTAADADRASTSRAARREALEATLAAPRRRPAAAAGAAAAAEAAARAAAAEAAWLTRRRRRPVESAARLA